MGENRGLDRGKGGNLIDRLVHHCVILELNVPSYRAEQAKKGRQEPGTAE